MLRLPLRVRVQAFVEAEPSTIPLPVPPASVENGPGLAPAFAPPPAVDVSLSDNEVPSNHVAATAGSGIHDGGVIQAQTGIAVALPGAFAVDGINSRE